MAVTINQGLVDDSDILSNERVIDMSETVAIESTANPPRVFVFTIRTGFDPNNAPTIAPLASVVDVMKPAHTKAVFTSKQMVGFYCNDAASLTNNTVL